jgi:two-component system, cell cycle response regulator DivK
MSSLDAPGTRRRVLLVEDNEDNRIIYRMILEHHGYDVIEAHDGQAGIEMARTSGPDLILMDISLPVMDGWEATRVLKADLPTSVIPIVALTAHALRSDEAKAAEIGFDAFIRKPAEPKLVLEIVQQFVGPAIGGA